MVYESLLVFGVAFFAGLIFYALTGGGMSPRMRHGFQAYLFLVIGMYFVWFWRHGGHTLAMKTWKLRVVSSDGSGIGLGRAMARYAYAWLSLGLGGIGVVYALFDRERQFLHDRLAGTKIVMGNGG